MCSPKWKVLVVSKKKKHSKLQANIARVYQNAKHDFEIDTNVVLMITGLAQLNSVAFQSKTQSLTKLRFTIDMNRKL